MALFSITLAHTDQDTLTGEPYAKPPETRGHEESKSSAK